MINGYFFKSLSLRSFVTAVIGNSYGEEMGQALNEPAEAGSGRRCCGVPREGPPTVEFHGAEEACEPAWVEKVGFSFSAGTAEAVGGRRVLGCFL